MPRKFFASGTEDVWITVGAWEWSKLPSWTREFLLAGIEGVAQIKNEIAAASKVGRMPPVQILCEHWPLPAGDGLAEGRCEPLQLKAGTFFGATLPGTTLAIGRSEIRRILVHEFAHCFWYYSEVVARAVAAGDAVVSTQHDPFDTSQDDAMLVEAGNWFGEEDARSMAHQNDKKGEWTDTLGNLIRVLPKGNPVVHFEVSNIAGHDEWFRRPSA